MQQFDLSIWLENKSRKVVTRLKKSVQIISIDGKEDIPIVALVEGIAHQYKPNGYHADVVLAYSNQCRDMGDYDLFFADEKEELTEFEKRIYNLINFSDPDNCPSIEEVKEEAEILLDLARKELEANYYTNVLDDRMVFKSELHATDLQTAYDMGKQDALKDLPKWKKAAEHKDFEINNVCILDDDIYPVIATNVNIGEYYIELDELKNLPIEE